MLTGLEFISSVKLQNGVVDQEKAVPAVAAVSLTPRIPQNLKLSIMETPTFRKNISYMGGGSYPQIYRSVSQKFHFLHLLMSGYNIRGHVTC